MAKLYIKPGITPGTGAGTFASPWNVNDVLVAGNPKSLAARDTVIAVTNGVTAYTVTANLIYPVAGLSIIPKDYSDALTVNKFTFDGAGLGSGDIMTSGLNEGLGILGKFINGPTNGLNISSNDAGVFYGCEFNDNALHGLTINVNSNSVGIESCSAEGNSFSGMVDNNTTRPSMFNKCYLAENNQGDNNNVFELQVNSARVQNCIVVMRGGTTIIYGGLAATFSSTDPAHLSNNVIYLPSGNVISSGTVYGIRGNGSNTGMWRGNIVQGLKNSGGPATAYSALATSAAPRYFRNNYAHDCDTAVDTNVATGANVYEAPITTDPQFGDPDAGNFVPDIDLTGAVEIAKIVSETAWLDIGALSHFIGAGGAGGISNVGSLIL